MNWIVCNFWPDFHVEFWQNHCSFNKLINQLCSKIIKDRGFCLILTLLYDLGLWATRRGLRWGFFLLPANIIDTVNWFEKYWFIPKNRFKIKFLRKHIFRNEHRPLVKFTHNHWLVVSPTRARTTQETSYFQCAIIVLANLCNRVRRDSIIWFIK